MVFVVTNFLTQFRDMNYLLATVQRPTITHPQVSTIFWFNASISAVIAMTIMILSPGIAWFDDEPRLVMISIALAVPIFFRGLVVQHEALLRRKLMFGTLTGIDVASTVTGYVVAIVLAWRGPATGRWSACMPAPPSRMSS